jgi:hypothetical protein
MYRILDVVVVEIDVFGALVVTPSFDKLKRGLVVAVKLNEIDIVADLVDLLEEVGELCSLIGGVRESDLPSFSCRGRDKLLFARAVTDSTASEFEEIARRKPTVLSVRK